MSLPLELQFLIISFTPETDLKSVSREWNDEIKIIQKKAVDKISNWYYKNRPHEYWAGNVNRLIRYYVINYPDDEFMVYPEFTVDKLRLNHELITVLPVLGSRRRSDVRDWMLNLPIGINDWMYVGW